MGSSCLRVEIKVTRAENHACKNIRRQFKYRIRLKWDHRSPIYCIHAPFGMWLRFILISEVRTRLRLVTTLGDYVKS